MASKASLRELAVDLGFGLQPVFELEPLDISALHILFVSRFADHALSRFRVDARLDTFRLGGFRRTGVLRRSDFFPYTRGQEISRRRFAGRLRCCWSCHMRPRSRNVDNGTEVTGCLAAYHDPLLRNCSSAFRAVETLDFALLSCIVD